MLPMLAALLADGRAGLARLILLSLTLLAGLAAGRIVLLLGRVTLVFHGRVSFKDADDSVGFLIWASDVPAGRQRMPD